MRIAVMSDIHGFDLALASVLREIDRRGPFDEVVVAGDICLVGPGPDKVLGQLRQTGITVLMGNTDSDIVNAAIGDGDGPEFEYVLERIGLDGVEFLRSLPFDRRISPVQNGSRLDDLLIVHANPHDLETKITPEMTDLETRGFLGDVEAAALAFGHHHVAFTREVDGTLLVDVSAVGNPKDSDLRCKFGILSWDTKNRIWAAEIVRIDYPLEETIAEMRASGMPDAEAAIQTLLRASY
jgi:predicted phosphodiesterase